MTVLKCDTMPFAICMASDFFYPNIGGVEEHIYNLSQCLIKRGHKVVVITHSYGDRTGIRYMKGNLKVYYLPITLFYNQSVLPTLICNSPLIRYILLREKIQIVHEHSAFSAIGLDVAAIGRLMGLRTVITDHSLLGFADAASNVINKLLQLAAVNCDHCICVSHTGKENTVLRAKVPSNKVSVIPNAVDTDAFTPEPSNRDPNVITIVVVSRLVYRKGVDLIAAIMADMCPRYPNIQFLVGGDGPKMWLLQEVRERKGLQHCITLLGKLEHSEVRDVLTRGHIFLNASLTEAYCMAIVEAAACGLQVVSTKVGGIPEVLPSELIYLTEPNVPSLIKGLENAMHDYIMGNTLCPYKCNLMVKEMYNWDDVSRRTDIVYQTALLQKTKTLGQQLLGYMLCGVWPYMLAVSLLYLIIRFMEIVVNKKDIDICKDWKVQKPTRVSRSNKYNFSSQL